MTVEEKILERLDRIEAQLASVSRGSVALHELQEDLEPIMKKAFKMLLEEFSRLEENCTMDDFVALGRQGLSSVRYITYALEQLQNAVDLWNTMEPLLKTTVHRTIEYMDKLERRGVFSTYRAMLDIREKVAANYGPEEIAAMGDGFVFILGLLKKLSNPELLNFLEKLTEIPSHLKLSECKELGPVGMVSAMTSKEAKAGLGVMVELLKALGTLKEGQVGVCAAPGK